MEITKVEKSSKPRGAKPGERRGGRKTGTPNKTTAELQARLAELKSDPITYLAKVMNDPKADPLRRDRVALELIQYMYPKRKAVEFAAGELTDGNKHYDLVELLTIYRDLSRGSGKE